MLFKGQWDFYLNISEPNFFSVWSFTVRTILIFYENFDNSKYFLSNFSEGVPASVVGETRVQCWFIDCQHQQKTFSVTTFYTLFAFGSACGAFLRASQNRGNIPSFGPFLLVHMTKSKKTSTTEARKIPERESLFVYYILGSETGAVYPICFPPLEQWFEILSGVSISQTNFP